MDIVETWRKSYPSDEIVVVVPHPRKMHASPEGIKLVTYPKIFHPFFNFFFVSFESWRNGSSKTLFHNFAGFARNGQVFIHDFIFLDHPEWFSTTQNLYFRLMKLLARLTPIKVFTSTNTELDRISRYIPSKDISVAPLGISILLKQAEPRKPQSFQLTHKDFFLTVGRNDIRKNLNMIIESYIEKSVTENLPDLIVIGLSTEEFLGSSHVKEMNNSIHFFKTVSNAELSWLYLNCDTFLFLSLDEGFGMPILEALYFNAPMVISDIKVFHEVSRENATFIDPNSTTAISGFFSTRNLMNRDIKRSVDLDPDLFSWNPCVKRLRNQEIHFGSSD